MIASLVALLRPQSTENWCIEIEPWLACFEFEVWQWERLLEEIEGRRKRTSPYFCFDCGAVGMKESWKALYGARMATNLTKGKGNNSKRLCEFCPFFLPILLGSYDELFKESLVTSFIPYWLTSILFWDISKLSHYWNVKSHYFINIFIISL